MLGDMGEVTICSEKGESILTTGCGNQKVDGACMDPFGTAVVPQASCCHMGLPMDVEKREGLKELEQSVKVP